MVGKVGFAPTQPMATDLQSVGTLSLSRLPKTWLRRMDSNHDSLSQSQMSCRWTTPQYWCGMRDSNSRPTRCKRAALPLRQSRKISCFPLLAVTIAHQALGSSLRVPTPSRMPSIRFPTQGDSRIASALLYPRVRSCESWSHFSSCGRTLSDYESER